MLWNMHKIVGTFSSEIAVEGTVHWLQEGRFLLLLSLCKKAVLTDFHVLLAWPY